MRRAVGITFEGDGRDTDRRSRGEPFLQFIILPLAVGQTEPPAVIVNNDVDVIRVVERRRAVGERRVVEAPLRGTELPNQLVEVVPVFLVTDPAAFRGEIELVPPLEL